MQSQHLPMTLDEFHVMPQQLGWKYEYWDGHAHITPRHSAIATTTVTVQPRSVDAPCRIRPVSEADLPGLHQAYLAAFQDTIDYCDWAPAELQTAARQNLAGFFAGMRGQPLPAAQIAISATDVVGAVLIVEKQTGQPFLDLLFVVPRWHRKGVATALVATALTSLAGAGYHTLTSRFMLGNAESRAWHHGFGFIDEPDLFLARTCYYHAQYELKRCAMLGDLTAVDHAALVAERDHWDKEVERLEAIAEKEGLAAVLPML